jgi:hypothetical protein
MNQVEPKLNSNLWETIENFKLPFSEEYLRQKYNWSPVYSRLAIAEYKKFTFLALVSDTEVTPSLDIDEVWHTHILHTRSYALFSMALGRQIHHDPGMPNHRGDFQEQYRGTLRFYKEIFGQDAPAALWPHVALQGEKKSMEKAYDAFKQS